MTIAILGRQPRLGMAELEALFGASSLQPLGSSAVMIEMNPHTIRHARLGGTIKLAKLITSLPTTDWRDVASYLRQHVPVHATHLPNNKLTLGLSAYGLRI